MIYDCFPFFNELELLEIRCEELKSLDVVHILVESPITHSGKEKPLYFQENKEAFKKYNIVHRIIDLPKFGTDWERERMQRDYISNVLRGIARPEDLIICSDCDEIVRASAIKNVEEITFLQMDNFYYYLNMLTDWREWNAGFIAKYKTIKDKSLTLIRQKHIRSVQIPSAGWHFTWMGGTYRIIEKLTSFAHQELNTDEFRDSARIEQRVGERKAFFHHGDPTYRPIPIEKDIFPQYLVDNQDKFKNLIC